MNEPIEWRNARILDRAVPGTLGGRLEQAQPIPTAPQRSRQPTPGRGHAFIVAASDASDSEKRGADVVCDGTDDQDQINAALAEAVIDGAGSQFPPSFVRAVKLTSGTFVTSDTIDVPYYGVLRGDGKYATVIRPADGITDCIAVDGGAFLKDFAIFPQAETASTCANGIHVANVSTVDSGSILEIAMFWLATRFIWIDNYVSDLEVGHCLLYNGSGGGSPDGIRCDYGTGHHFHDNYLSDCGIYAVGAVIDHNRTNEGIEVVASGETVSRNIAAAISVAASDCRIFDNFVSGSIEVISGDKNWLHRNYGDITVDAGVTNTHVVDNRAAVTNAGTGTVQSGNWT